MQVELIWSRRDLTCTASNLIIRIIISILLHSHLIATQVAVSTPKSSTISISPELHAHLQFALVTMTVAAGVVTPGYAATQPAAAAAAAALIWPKISTRSSRIAPTTYTSRPPPRPPASLSCPKVLPRIRSCDSSRLSRAQHMGMTSAKGKPSEFLWAVRVRLYLGDSDLCRLTRPSTPRLNGAAVAS